MKVLVVGSGGREHALAWKLSQEAEVLAAPGNPGIAECARNLPISASDHVGIVDLALAESVDLVVVGPEDPLIAGLADGLRGAGLNVFGPGAEGAKLEGSKAFSKSLMASAGVRTAEFQVFDQPGSAHDFVRSIGGPMVVKASGAAVGKGALVLDSEEQAHEAVDAMLVEHAFGDAGSTIVIEERLSGPEYSLLTLCSEGEYWSLPVAQDHKRALDGDRGPNTGGMGTFSPVPSIDADLVRRTEREVVEPILRALQAKRVSFRGVLFSGLMLHRGDPYCLEFNVRFGDPEIQSLVLRMGAGFLDALVACAEGRAVPPVEILENAAVSVVVASGGYPNAYEKGKPITIGELPEGIRIFHAGTATSEGRLVTNGGRVAAVSAVAPNLMAAKRLAYEGVSRVSFEGKHFRKDIGP